MKQVLPRSFHLITGLVYLLLALSVIAFIFQIASFWRPLQYHSNKIEMYTPRDTGISTLSLEYFRESTLKDQPEGNITLHSPSGKSYEAYYSRTLRKLKVTIPDNFAEALQLIIRLNYFLNCILLIVILYSISEVLASLEKGSPYIVKNAKYIGLISTILFYFLFADYIINWSLESYIELEFNLIFNMFPNGNSIMVALFASVLAILSYVLKQGSRIKEEQDLTI